MTQPRKTLVCVDDTPFYHVTSNHQDGILFSLPDYMELLDTTGRILREDKHGAIPLHLPPYS